MKKKQIDTRKNRNRKQPKWMATEYAVARCLNWHGVPAHAVGGTSHKHWDVITSSGIKIECKQASLLKGEWAARLSRQQVKDADFLVCALHGLQGKKGENRAALYVIIPKPEKTSYRFTIRSLFKRASQIGAWHLIVDEHKRRGGEMATRTLSGN